MDNEIKKINAELESDNKKIEEVYSKLFGASLKLSEQIEVIRKYALEQSQNTNHANHQKSLFKIQKSLIDLQLKASLMASKVDEEAKNPKNYKPLYIEEQNENINQSQEEKEDPNQENIV